MNAKNKSRKLGCEQLEVRELMAGNVSVYLDNASNLHLLGDSQANQVDIQDIGSNVYKVTGLSGTKINGANVQYFNVATDKVEAHMGNGNDYIYLHDSVMKAFGMDMGKGEDTVYVNKVSVTDGGNSAILKMGTATEADVDTVLLYNDRFYGNLHTTMGGGDDYISFNNTSVGQYLSVWGEGGNDSYRWVNSNYSKLHAWNSIERKV